MGGGVTEYTAPPGLKMSKVKAVLSDQYSCSIAPRRRTRCVYLDTFDWRIHADGAMLELTSQDGKFSATWVDLNASERPGSIVLDRQPRFAEDISSLPLRRRLAPVIEMRALLPQIEVQNEIETLALMNQDRKTVVRIQLVTESSSEPGHGKSLNAITYLKVIPFRGYSKHRERVMRVLTDEFDLAEIEGDPIRRTMAKLHRAPDDPSRLWVELNADMRADTAMKLVLQHLFNTIDVNEEGTKTNIDSEFLHDFRVAIRRTRSVCTQVKGVFPSEVLQRFTSELKWLGGVTGATRDLDVYLLIFDQYKHSLPDFQRDHLEPLREFLQVHQKLEQQELATSLSSSRYRELKRDWRTLVDLPDAETTTLPNAARPIKDVVNGRIWRAYRQVIKQGRAIGPKTLAVELHDLRKTCKKLRYLMEIFQALYPSAKLKRLIKVLKVLQENLGDFQDFEVQSVTLRKFGQQMKDESHVGADTLFAMGALIANLDKRQREARRAFSAIFDEFDCIANHALFKEVFLGELQQPVAA